MSTSIPLKQCPNKPNCVSSLSQDRKQSMLPLHFRGSMEQSKQIIKDVIAQMPRTQLESESSNSLVFTFKTAFFGFVDDVEFYFDDKNLVVHFRSASRLGYSDLGVNRKRMDDITKNYQIWKLK